MALDIENEQTLRRYFLGELPRHQHKLIEKSFFEDDQLFERLLSTEEQLIADYVRGALEERERLRFVSYFLSTPQRRQKVKELAEASAVTPAPQPVAPPPANARPDAGLLSELKRLWSRVWGSRWALQVSFVAIALAIIVGLWLAIVRLGERPPQPVATSVTPTPQVTEVRTPTPQPGNVATPLPGASPELTPSPNSNIPARKPGPPRVVPPSQPDGPAVIALLLPGLSRGASPETSVTIQPNTPNVLLKVRLMDERLDLYSAALLNEERREVRRWRERAPQGEGKAAEVIFDLSARGLAEGYYYLILYGVGPTGKKVKVDTYPFQIERP